MTPPPGPREWWLSRHDLEVAERDLNLGEHRRCEVYLYPHKDTIPLLIHVVEARALQDAQAEIAQLRKERDEYEKRCEAYSLDCLYAQQERDALAKENERIRACERDTLDAWKNCNAERKQYADKISRLERALEKAKEYIELGPKVDERLIEIDRILSGQEG